MKHKFNIASFSSRRRSIAHKHTGSILQTPKSISQMHTQDEILNKLTPKQYKLFENIYSDSKRASSCKSKSETKHQVTGDVMEVNEVISEHLKKKQQLNHFRNMYSIQTPETKGLGKYPFILETKQEKEKLLLKKLSSNPEELANAYQNSLLQFYHYRDLKKQSEFLSSKYIPKDINAAMHRRYSQAKNKIDIKYLQGDFDIQKHRRLSKSTKNTQDLYSKHNQESIKKEKLISFMKNQKQVKQAVRLARRNLSYKRALNIDRIKYLISCMSQNQQQVKPQPEERQIINGMFFRFSNREGNEKSRYKQITLQKFLDLFKKLDLKQLTKKEAEQIFYQTVAYKGSQKILCKEDFISVIKKMAQIIYKQNKPSVVAKFVNNYIKPKKQMYQEEIHQIWQNFDNTATSINNLLKDL